jgi:hypothetical protein
LAALTPGTEEADAAAVEAVAAGATVERRGAVSTSTTSLRSTHIRDSLISSAVRGTLPH